MLLYRKCFRFIFTVTLVYSLLFLLLIFDSKSGS